MTRPLSSIGEPELRCRLMTATKAYEETARAGAEPGIGAKHLAIVIDLATELSRRLLLADLRRPARHLDADDRPGVI